jgi:mannose-1-phosphate guanylyltransferase
MFFWRAATVIELMRRHLPKTATLLAGLPSINSRGFQAKLEAVYPMCENISVDYGIMEKAGEVAGLAVDDVKWNDVGSWEAVYALARKDKDRNASRGDLVVESSHGNYVDVSRTVALVGVDDLVVVDTPDALLITHRSRSQDVSKLVKTLEAKKRDELL